MCSVNQALEALFVSKQQPENRALLLCCQSIEYDAPNYTIVVQASTNHFGELLEDRLALIATPLSGLGIRIRVRAPQMEVTSFALEIRSGDDRN